jgi:hypothetical protein
MHNGPKCRVIIDILDVCGLSVSLVLITFMAVTKSLNESQGNCVVNRCSILVQSFVLGL